MRRSGMCCRGVFPRRARTNPPGTNAGSWVRSSATRRPSGRGLLRCRVAQAAQPLPFEFGEGRGRVAHALASRVPQAGFFSRLGYVRNLFVNLWLLFAYSNYSTCFYCLCLARRCSRSRFLSCSRSVFLTIALAHCLGAALILGYLLPWFRYSRTCFVVAAGQALKLCCEQLE